MEKLVESAGITALSKSQVSEMAKDLDVHVAEFRYRPLDAGPYTFLVADALVRKVREGGRVVGVRALLATGVNADGHREILGLQVTSAEDGAGWPAFYGRPHRPRPDRGAAGHLRRPRRAGRRHRGDPARGGLAALPHPLRGEPDGDDPESVLPVGAGPAALGPRPTRATSVHAHYNWVLHALADKLPRVAEHLKGARPNVLAEQHDEWIEGRRYLSPDALTRSKPQSNTHQEATMPALTASPETQITRNPYTPPQRT